MLFHISFLFFHKESYRGRLYALFGRTPYICQDFNWRGIHSAIQSDWIDAKNHAQSTPTTLEPVINRCIILTRNARTRKIQWGGAGQAANETSTIRIHSEQEGRVIRWPDSQTSTSLSVQIVRCSGRKGDTGWGYTLSRTRFIIIVDPSSFSSPICFLLSLSLSNVRLLFVFFSSFPLSFHVWWRDTWIESAN